MMFSVRCPGGTFFNVLRQKCESCLRGSYQPEEGQYSCHLCPNLTSTHRSNSRSKDDCKGKILINEIKVNNTLSVQIIKNTIVLARTKTPENIIYLPSKWNMTKQTSFLV